VSRDLGYILKWGSYATGIAIYFFAPSPYHIIVSVSLVAITGFLVGVLEEEKDPHESGRRGGGW